MTAIDLFGAIDVGLALPISAQYQQTWHVGSHPIIGDARPGTWGGHSVILVAYYKNVLGCITWGQIKFMTWEWLATYCDEAWALLSNDWVSGNSPAPSGFDLSQLQQDLQAL
jgi:hypothetical protein